MKRLSIIILLVLGLTLCLGARADNPYEIEPPLPEGYELPYTLAVFLANQVVVAYDAETLQPVKQMICSTGAAGTPTMTGTFRMPGNNVASWSWFGSCYVRFPTRIKNSYYFHSVLYSGMSPASLNSISWSKLGTRASHGCIRMTPIDAQWIAYNCKKGTRVRIVGGDSIHELKVIRDDIRKELNKRGHMAFQPTLRPTPTPLPVEIRLGSSGVSVRSLQNRLTQRGFYPGAISGVFDQATETAWNEYQTARGWAADGVATTEEQVALADDETTVAYRCTLKKGSTGPIVFAVEERLRKLGFFSGEPSKTYDDNTVAAVKKYQTAGGMTPANGVLTPAMQETLFGEAAPTPTPAPDLAPGSRGERVTRLQRRLYTLGFYAGKTSGRYDAATQRAVVAYQKAIGVSETGTADGALQIRINTDDSVVGAERTLVLRSKGVVVRVLEEKLQKLGFFTHEPDLIYDKKSVTAVKAFEIANSLPPAGIGTRAVIEAILAARP